MKVSPGWCSWFFPLHWSVFHVNLCVVLYDFLVDLLFFLSFLLTARTQRSRVSIEPLLHGAHINASQSCTPTFLESTGWPPRRRTACWPRTWPRTWSQEVRHACTSRILGWPADGQPERWMRSMWTDRATASTLSTLRPPTLSRRTTPLPHS